MSAAASHDKRPASALSDAPNNDAANNDAPNNDAPNNDAANNDAANNIVLNNDAPNNIVLTGFMGTGKSTVGRLLAEQLGLQHVDTDQLIERRHGPIPRIFEEQGEAGFRDIERELAIELATDVGYVISTGGRFMLDPHNAKLLTKGNRVFCLVADIDVIMDRVMRRRASRPMLGGPNPRARVLELMKEREAGYAEFEPVTTDERPATQVVDEILSRLSRR